MSRTCSGNDLADDLAVRRRSGGSRGRRSGRSAARGRGPAGAGSWRAGRGCGPCSRRRSSRSRRSRRSASRRFTPPPASHIVKPSRVVVAAVRRPAAVGVRPNSPPHQTSVSSSRPRAFRSLQQAGDRPVDFAGVLRVARPCRSPCWSHCRCCRCASPGRTARPRSAKRRAIRHCRPKFAVTGSSRPYSLCVAARFAGDVLDLAAPRSACGRPARTSRSAPSSAGSGPVRARCSRFISASRSSCSRCTSRGSRGVADVPHPRLVGRDAGVAERRALVGGRQEGRAPVVARRRAPASGRS